MNRTPPSPDEIEISLFGPGFGESIVAHLGGGEWLVIDSCRGDGSILPLEYLRELKVPISTNVKAVLATHWHNDHIRGLSDIVTNAASAQFYCSAALDCAQLRTLTEMWEETEHRQSPSYEFQNILRLLEGANRSIDYASSNKTLWRNNIAEVIALAPSGQSITQAYRSIASLVDEVAKTRSRAWAPCPNFNSVALWIRVGAVEVLLGGDLEESAPCRGWSILLDSPLPLPGKASAFKIAHHMSATGHHEPVWTQLLHNQPIAICTPFQKGRVVLPNRSDVVRTLGYTQNAYITCVPRDHSRRARTGTVNKTMLEATRSLKDLNTQPGHIRLRRRTNGSNGWTVELSGGARLLDPNDFN